MFYNPMSVPCSRQISDQMDMQGISMYPSPAIGTALPTGLPYGPTYAPVPTQISTMPPAQVAPAQVAMPAVPTVGAAPQTVQEPYYTAGFLRSQIGRRMRVEFLLGTNGPLIDRTGTLLAVGASYILLRPDNTDDVLMCDLYSIKFVTIYY